MIKALINFHGKTAGELIPPSDALYSVWKNWAEKGSVFETSKICEFVEDAWTLEKLIKTIDNDNDKLEEFCKEHDIAIPENYRWNDRYETLIKELE